MTETAAAAPAIAFMATADRVSLVLNGRFRGYLLASEQGKQIMELLRQDPQDIEKIGELADIQTWVAKQSQGRVSVDDCDRLRLDGKLIDYGLTGRVAKVIEQGVSFKALANFIERLDRNPDPTVKEDLYRFMEKGNLPFDPDGYILGFKKVDNAYYSFWSGGKEEVRVFQPDVEEPVLCKGKVLYPLNGRVEMDREQCDPNRDRTCSRGLHVCSYEYLNYWYRQQGHVLIIRVDPEHVTAIPADHNDQKLRCCQLEVVAEIPEEEAKLHFSKVVDARYPAKPAEVEETAAEAEEIDWTERADGAGEEAGEADRKNGYEFEPSGMKFPEDLPDEERPAYSLAWLDGYTRGYGTGEGSQEHAWTHDLARTEAEKAATDQAQTDFPQYDNNSDDASARGIIVEAVEAAGQDSDDHPLLETFDKAYRDTYHHRFNELEAGDTEAKS